MVEVLDNDFDEDITPFRLGISYGIFGGNICLHLRGTVKDHSM
jgi:hypothetical protein